MRLDISMLVNTDPINYKTGGKAIKEKVAAAIDALFAARAKNKYEDHIVIMGDDPKGPTVKDMNCGYDPLLHTGRGANKIGSIRLVKTHCVPW